VRQRAKRVLSAHAALAGEIVTSEYDGSTHLRGTYACRIASPSEGVDSLLGGIAQRMCVRVLPRARPCLRVWSIQMDCSVCRSACGLTRRETNPASAEGWRASWSVARVVSNGRRVQAVFVCIRATACIPATLTHAIVLRPMLSTPDLVREARKHFVVPTKNICHFSPRHPAFSSPLTSHARCWFARRCAPLTARLRARCVAGARAARV
jgi:hypothetical protein